MRLLAVALTLSFAGFAAASAQTATPDSENGRYSFNPVADGVLRLDTRTGQVSQCSRSDAGWACKVVPAERCRHRQGGFVRRESLAPFDRHGQEGAARRREEKLRRA